VIGVVRTHRLIAIGCCVVLTSTACAFDGLNSLPLPGAVGRGPDANIYHVEFASIGLLEPNSPVMIDDVVVGSVGRMNFTNWHVDVELSLKPDVVVPANAMASIGQTSLLGSMHVALDPPLGQPPRGRLQPGTALGVNSSSTYPSTERTLASLAAVVNGGGLGQVGDIIHNLSAALSGREERIRDLLIRLDSFVGMLDQQRNDVIASIEALNRLAGTLADQRGVIDRALRTVPRALDVLIRERPRITSALDKLRVFSDTATRLVNDTQADLVTNLQNLDPTLRALADVGPGLDAALGFATTYPYTQNRIDRGFRGDYINQFIVLDLTIPRLKRTLFLGTRWGEEGAKLVPAPGEPSYLNYSYDPLHAPMTPYAPSAPGGGPPPVIAESSPTPPVNDLLLPVAPPPSPAEASGVQTSSAPAPIFAGPYATPPPAAPPLPGGP
jgi:phospholipid/cholesterol/gamma-HCH transport system substrate-binding protein